MLIAGASGGHAQIGMHTVSPGLRSGARMPILAWCRKLAGNISVTIY